MTDYYEFIPPGSVVRPQNGKIYLDVGNVDAPLVFDHHYLGSQARSTTSLVVRDLARLPGLAKAQGDIHVVTHQKPDLDAIASSWVVSKAMNRQAMDPVFLAALADYVDAIDQGFTALSSADDVPLYVLIGGPFDCDDRELPFAKYSDAQKLRYGHEVLDSLHNTGNYGFASLPLNKASEEAGWQAASKRLKTDRQAYKDDLSRAVIGTIRLPKIDNTETAELTCVRLTSPRALFFKSWARGDISLQPGPMLMIGLSPTRVIFSVPPGAGVYLKGLADLLEEYEIRDGSEAGCSEAELSNRPGYSHPDPWYDGRGTAHNYTIVDSPRAGTRLSWQSLDAILTQYSASLP